MELRPYQSEMLERVVEAVGTNRRLLIQMPTGSGKTVLAAEMIRRFAEGNMTSLFITHRREILFQTIEKIEAFGTPTGIILSGDPWDPRPKAHVASIQTFYSWFNRKQKYPKPPADVLFFDESQHFGGGLTWRKVADLYPKAVIIGLTATPMTNSGKGLGNFFDKLLCGPSVKRGIAEGWLVQPKYFVPSLPDLKKIKITAGDYNQKQLEERMDRPNLIGDILMNWQRFADGKKTMIFTSGVKHSLHLAEEARKIGIPAEHIDGEMEKSERDLIVKKFRADEVRMITNCLVFNEGADFPDLECLVLARPTKSEILYLQMCGRALRPYEGKTEVSIIDHAGAYYEHGPVEQDREWALEYEDRHAEERIKLRNASLKTAITCKACGRVYKGAVICPSCGKKLERFGKPVDTWGGWLQALKDEDIKEEAKKQRTSDVGWYLMLRGYAQQKNYKNGWAAHKYKDRFGDWPKWSWNNFDTWEPNTEVLSWLRGQYVKRFIVQKWREKREKSHWKSL